MTRPTNQLQAFSQDIQSYAVNYLSRILGSEAGQRAGARTAMAFSAAVRAARKPADLMSCSRESVATCIAMSALTELMPGGPAPAVWLIPKGGELQWWLSHRGIATLCLRAGYQIIAVPVSTADEYRIEFGEVVAHDGSGEQPDSLADLAGVYLTVRRLDSGQVLCRPWIGRAAIEKRRKTATSQDVWRKWPVEMAQKTALKWAIARGLLPVEGMELNLALAAEPTQDALAEAPATPARAAFGATPQTAPESHRIEERPADLSESAPAREADTVEAQVEDHTDEAPADEAPADEMEEW